MNTFGRIFRVNVLGESHGSCVGVLIDGCPAGLPLAPEDFFPDLERRKGGSSVGTTPRTESDEPLLQTGTFEGRTTGAPLLIIFANRNVRSDDYAALRDTPRPGHADLTGRVKFGGFNDPRGGGHFSGRLTAGLVAAGVVAKRLMPSVLINAALIEAGGSDRVADAVRAAMEDGDSVGGIVECRISGLPVGLGEPFFDSVESVLSHAVFAIPAVKGIEFGSGFAGVALRGSEFNDSIISPDGKTSTNNAGGINGGITNGNDIYFRVAVKPTSSIRKERRTVDLRTGHQTTISVQGRHDACIALRVPVVLEAVAAFVLADLMRLENQIPGIWRG